jgi:hypothetical protein
LRRRLQLNRQMVHVDFDTNEMGVNELSVICWCGFVQLVADGADDKSFNLVCGHPRDRSGALSLSLDQSRGNCRRTRVPALLRPPALTAANR